MMEMSIILNNLAELGMDDPSFFHQWPLVSTGDIGPVSFGSPFCHEEPHHPFSVQPAPDEDERAPESTQLEPNKPLKHLETSISTSTFHFINDKVQEGISKPKMEAWTLDFPSESVVSESSFGNMNYVLRPCQGAKRVRTNTRAKDNVLAERKRRERLGERFAALSALVPGLKKMDKSSVLGDATKYIKQLQEKVKILEEQTKKKSIESVVFAKKNLHCSENSSSDKSGPLTAEPLPEIEARFSNNDVLINILCEKRNGLLEKTVAEIEKLHLSVVNSSAMTFGDSALYIAVMAKSVGCFFHRIPIEKLHLSVVNSSAMTFGDSALYIAVMAKKDDECTMNTKELLQNLSTALKTFT